MRLGQLLAFRSLKKIIFFLYCLVPSFFFFLKVSDEGTGQLFLYSNQRKIVTLIKFLKLSPLFQLRTLNDISVIDFLKLTNRFKVIYNLSSLNFNERVFVSTFLESSSVLLSLQFLFRSSCWLEREVWDMFGLVFKYQKDLRRILTDYGFNGFPLRKDFPLSGYTEVRYDESLGDVIFEPLELSQELRFYNFTSGWEKNY